MKMRVRLNQTFIPLYNHRKNIHSNIHTTICPGRRRGIFIISNNAYIFQSQYFSFSSPAGTLHGIQGSEYTEYHGMMMFPKNIKFHNWFDSKYRTDDCSHLNTPFIIRTFNAASEKSIPLQHIYIYTSDATSTRHTR